MSLYDKFLCLFAFGIGCVAVYGIYLKRRIERLRKLIGRDRLEVLREEARRAAASDGTRQGDEGPGQGNERE